MARPTRSGLLRRSASGEARPRGSVWRFFGEVISELKKVTWPSRQETTRLTLLVIAVAVSIGIALGLIDLLFTRLVDQVLF